VKFGDAEFEIEGCISKEIEGKISDLCELFKQAIYNNPKPPKAKEKKSQETKRTGSSKNGSIV
jgi:hypothetical protein